MPEKIRRFLAVIIIIACFCSPFSVFAKGFKITTEQLDRLQTVLSLVKTFMNTAMNGEAITKAMNFTFRVEGMAADIGYGLVVMSALNELDLIDMIVSQRYKQQATAFFEKVVDDKTNLVSYWKGVGFDLPRILKQTVTSPMAALSLESFQITDKAIAIFSTFEVIRQGKIYDGIWYYFDSRRNNDSHDTAWSNAVDLMGFAAKSTSFHIIKSVGDEKEKQLESQFISLWDKWGRYTDSNGVTEEAKQIFSVEAGEMVSEAIRKQQIAESQQKSIADKMKSSLTKFAESVQSLGERVANTGANLISTTKNAVNNAMSSLGNFVSSRYRWFQAAIIDLGSGDPPPSGTVLVIDESANKDIEEKAKTLQEAINNQDNSNQLSVVTQRIDEFSEALKNAKEEANSSQPKTAVVNNPPEESAPPSEPVICSFDSQLVSASSVIINEVAWMGTIVSGDNEWIELKNVSSREINLNGWQLLDRGKQIKIIFGAEKLPPSGLYLLERSNDDAVPEIKADRVYTGRLNDTDEELYLFDNQCQIRDKVIASPNWLGGDKKTKQTIERRSNRDWQTSNASNGTPKRENSYGSIYYVSGPSGGSVSSSSGQSGAETVVDTGLPLVLISEVASGITSSANEYITLYNPTDKEITLSDDNFKLKLVDSADKATAKKIVWSRKKIPVGGYFLLTAGSISGISSDATFSAQLSGTSGVIITDGSGSVKDRLAWGECLPSDCGADRKQPPSNAAEAGGKVLTGGLKTDQSLKRTNGVNGKPADSDNNETDFIINSEPTIINSLGDSIKIAITKTSDQSQSGSNDLPNNDPLVKDTTAPAVSFLSINATQFLPSFTISWSGEDSGGTVTPSGMDGFIIRYSEDKTNWTYQPSETTYDIATSYLFTGEYDHQYYFEVKGRDKEGNQSGWSPTDGLKVAVETAPTGLVINEVAWMGTVASTSDEWIEFINISDKIIDISDWSIYGAGTSKCLNFIDADGNSTILIKSGEYLVYGNDQDTVKDETGQSIVDIWDATISLNNASPGQLILYPSKNCQGSAVDTVNQSDGDWLGGDNGNNATMERVNPQLDGTDASSWKDNDTITKNGFDAEGNPLNGTPKAKNSVYANLPPKAITDLAVDIGNSTDNKVILKWSAPDSNGNPIEGLSYDIRYLAGKKITKDNWINALPLTSEPAVLI
ncbi:MAG: lamin tail domain-containing protein, partial [bacterium]